MGFLDIIAAPLGQLLYFIYNTIAFNRYGVALIIFTLIIRAAMLPLTIKQYKSMGKTQEIQPKIQEIQKRYKNDKEKLNQELMKIYQENNVNPAGGCLPLLIQMPILLSLWQVISRPLTFMLQWDAHKVVEFREKLGLTAHLGYPELEIIRKYVDEAGNKLLNMEFLGLNLGLIPQYGADYLFKSPDRLQYWGLLIIPLLATITTYLSSRMSLSKSNQNAQTASMNNSMLLIAPIMTLLFSFQFPAGLGLYWLTGNLIQMLQQWYINNYVLKKKEVAVK